MAKFFQNFDDEKQETKSKAKEIIERSHEKLSKREIKFAELQDRINDVKNSGKNFEKNFRRFMNDVKKYVSYFESNTIPDFLINFLNDERIRSSKPMSLLSDDFIKQFTSTSSETTASTILKKSTSKKTKSLDSILLLENDSEKEPELVEYLEKCTDDDLKSEIYIALFSIYLRMKNPFKMIEMFKLMNLNLNNSQMKSVVKNLDVYLGKISTLINKENLNAFSDLLTYLKNSNFSIDQTVIQKRELEIEYFILENAPINTHPQFQLLFLVRNKKWVDSKSYYNENQNIFDSSKTSNLILIEFAELANKNQEFDFAFEIFSKCYNNIPSSDLKIKLFALCVILNKNLSGVDIFNEFVEEFKKFESNYCCLPSNDLLTELHRAFYYINILDHKIASDIIEKNFGIQTYEYLKTNLSIVYNEKFQFEN